jgi:hypothetical protein
VGSERVVKAKKDCCQSSPRCKRCPVVCKRLVAAGLASRAGGRRYVLDPATRKKDVKAARKKRPKPARA